MTLNEVNHIIELCFKKHHRAWMNRQRAASHPSESDIIKILTNSNYVNELRIKEEQCFASIQYWERALKTGTYKCHVLDGWDKKYWKLETHDTIRKELKDIHNKELQAA